MAGTKPGHDGYAGDLIHYRGIVPCNCHPSPPSISAFLPCSTPCSACRSRGCAGATRCCGDGDNIKLRSAIRAHANFAEYVPLIVLMVAVLEMSGLAPLRVHLLMALLLLARLLHPLGMYVGPRTLQFQICRVGGISLTLLVMLAAALQLVSRFWLGAS